MTDAEHAEAEAVKAKNARGRDKRKFQIHANLPRASKCRLMHREPLAIYYAIIAANFVPPYENPAMSAQA
jgi:hypothetical protein